MIDNIVTETPDAEKRRCYDCGWMKAAHTWWCMNKECIAARGTSIPGIHGCPYWKPAEMKIVKPKKNLFFWRKQK